MEERLLNIKEVENICRLKKSAIYNWMKQGKFPEPLKLGRKTVFWRESDLKEWIDSLPKAKYEKQV